MEATTKVSVYDKVTERVINALEAGVAPWHRPWTMNHDGSIACARRWTTGKPYDLINQLFLPAGEYLSFNDIQKAGARIKKGCHAQVVYGYFVTSWTTTKQVETTNEDGETETIDEEVNHDKWTLKAYSVFSVDDVEGLPEKRRNAQPAVEQVEPDTTDADDACEAALLDYCKKYSIKFRKGSNDAFYRPSTDEICVPALHQYKSTAEYLSTAAHEVTHSTGHASRLARKGVVNNDGFGGNNYSQEELVAEMGAAMILTSMGVETDGAFNNSAAYLQGWLKRLRNDKKLIVVAAKQAEKAVEFILGRKAV